MKNNKRNRYISMLFLFICLFLLILPGGVGYLADKIVHKIFQETSIAEMQHLYFEPRLLQYHRGWFDSTMETSIGLHYPFLRFFLPTPAGQLPNVVLEANTHFYHGPFMYVTEIDGEKRLRQGMTFGTTVAHLSPATLKLIHARWNGTIPAFTSDYFVGLNQRFQSCNYNPAFSLKSKTGDMAVVFGGAKTCADTNRAVSDVINDLNFRRISIETPTLSSGTDGFVIHYVEKKQLFGGHPLWPGHYELKIPQAWFRSATVGDIQARDTTLTSTSHLKETWYDITTEIQTKNLQWHGTPGYFHYLGTFRHFDASSFAQMRRHITLQGLALPLNQMLALATSNAPLIAQFLAKSPVYELQDLSLRLGHYQLKATGKIEGAFSCSPWQLDIHVSKPLAEVGMRQFYRWLYAARPLSVTERERLSTQATEKQLAAWRLSGEIVEKKGLLEGHWNQRFCKSLIFP